MAGPLSTSPAARPQPTPLPLRPADDAAAVATPLPQPLTSFVGREAEIAAVCSLLQISHVRLVTLTGPGGAGKTRLAIRVAEELTDLFSSCCFVSLAAIRDPDLVIPTIAQARGVPETGGRPLFERLAANLSDGTTLLILDNFEQVLDAGNKVTELLARSAGLKILLTSRVVLRVTGEHDYPVPPLALPRPTKRLPLPELSRTAAVALFVQRAQAANPAFVLTEVNAGSVTEICARLDGLPLAIELAAAHSRLLSPAALLARLTHRLALLTGGPRDQPPRLQAMRDAIAWSYDLLPEEQQALFRRICIFADGFTLEAFEAVAAGQAGEQGSAGVSPATLAGGRDGDQAALQALGALLDTSLLSQEQQPDGEPRFRMLETIREYGLERLAESGEEASVRADHAAYYLGLAEQAVSRLIVAGASSWVDHLAIERANLRTAVEWALVAGNTDAVLRLAGTLLSFVYARGEPDEGLVWLERALAARGATPPVVQADALFTASALAQVQGDFARSLALSEEGLAIAREHGYTFGEARAQLGIGITAEWQGDLGEANRRYAEADMLMRTLGEMDRLPHWTVLPLANLADIALLRGDTARAVHLGEEAVQRWREAGYLWGIAQALGTVAAALCEQGKTVKAAVLYGETLDVWLACFDGRGIAGTIAAIAGLAAALGQLERAARLLGAAWALGETLGVRFLAHHLYAERVLATTRGRVDTPTFARSWEAGSALSLDAAVTEARAALESAGTPARAAHGLTPRELDVLRLLVAGHSDREIAATLSISPRTVQTHVAGLFAKLDAGTRAEATAVAIRRGLI
jgi:non-specific serine/threonine protein kinase